MSDNVFSGEVIENNCFGTISNTQFEKSSILRSWIARNLHGLSNTLLNWGTFLNQRDFFFWNSYFLSISTTLIPSWVVSSKRDFSHCSHYSSSRTFSRLTTVLIPHKHISVSSLYKSAVFLIQFHHCHSDITFVHVLLVNYLKGWDFLSVFLSFILFKL